MNMKLADAYFNNVAKLVDPTKPQLSEHHVQIMNYTCIFNKQLRMDQTVEISLQIKNGVKNSLNFDLSLIDQSLKDIIKQLFQLLVYGKKFTENLDSYAILLDYAYQLRHQLINKYQLPAKVHETLSLIDLTRYNYLMQTLRQMDPPNQMIYSYANLYEKVYVKMDDQFSQHNLTKLARDIQLNKHTSSVTSKQFNHEFFPEITRILQKHFRYFYTNLPSVVFIAIIQEQILSLQETTFYSIVTGNTYLVSEDGQEYRPDVSLNSPQFDVDDFVSEFQTIGKLDQAAKQRLAAQIISVNESSSYTSFQQIPSQIEAKLKQVGSRLTPEQIQYFHKLGHIIQNTPERTYKLVIAQLRDLYKRMQ